MLVYAYNNLYMVVVVSSAQASCCMFVRACPYAGNVYHFVPSLILWLIILSFTDNNIYFFFV